MTGIKDTKAGKDAQDPDRLLEGEDPKSDRPDDIEHWFKVYVELVQTKAALLAALSQRLADEMKPEARREVAETDLEILHLELGRFQKRLDFWRARWEGLEQSA